jgi:hypothetical protein
MSDAVKTISTYTDYIAQRGCRKLLKIRASYLKQELAQVVKEEGRAYVVADG